MKYRLTISIIFSLCLLATNGALFLFLYSIDGDIGRWAYERRAVERMQMMQEFHRTHPRPASIGSAPAYGEGWFIIEPKLVDKQWNGPGLLPGDQPEPLPPSWEPPPPIK